MATIKLVLTGTKGPIKVKRRKSKMSDEFIEEEILKPIKHGTTTIKGPKLLGETLVQIAEYHNMGKKYPYHSIKQDKSKDRIISI